MTGFSHTFSKDSGTMLVSIHDWQVLTSSSPLVDFYVQSLADGVSQWDVDLRTLDLIQSEALGMLIAFNASVTSRGGQLRLILKKESKVTNLVKFTQINRIINVVMS